MATAFVYNNGLTNTPEIYTASSGGTVFSANLGGGAAFDYFGNSAVVNDAIYFANGANGAVQSDFVFYVGTAMAGTGITLAWEYYKRGVGWTAMSYVQDDTNGFTTLGANRVRFPIQWQRATVTINGLIRMWTRCRITAVTTITEGGANSTNRVQHSDGAVTISGSTDGSPSSWNELYTWLTANVARVPCYKRNDSSYSFTNFAVVVNSRLTTQNEVIELGSDGPSSQGGGQNKLDYVTSGLKIGTRGYYGSTFIVYGQPNTAVLNAAANTKMYGTCIRGGKYSADGGNFAGYLSLSGEWIDCVLDLSTTPPGAGQSVTYCRFTDGLVIATQIAGTFNNNFYMCTNSVLFYVYQLGWTLRDFSFKFTPASASLIYLYNCNGYIAPVWKFLNPATSLGLMGDSIAPLSISEGLSTLTSCFFYDSGTTTYTDYTTQAGNATTNDVPLTGNVGDYYLFNLPNTSTNAYGSSLSFTITNQSNDYGYVWETYTAGAWVQINSSYLWDTTANLTKSGSVYSGAPTSTVTINGVSGNWIRLRITSKGTATPTASVIKQLNAGHASNWSLQEKYSFNLKVTNTSGTPINTVSVAGNYTGGASIFATTTDSNGLITEQEMYAKEFHFDPINNPSTKISQNLYTSMDLTLRKYGYIYQKQLLGTTAPLSNIAQLAVNSIPTLTEAQAGALTGISIDGATKTITVSSSHTAMEVYQYSQWWAAQSANLLYTEPITTVDGVNFVSVYNITLNTGVNLTGGGSFNMGTLTFTKTGTATYDGIIITSTNRIVHLIESGLVASSILSIYDTTTPVSIYSGTVSGTSLDQLYTYTADKNVSIDVKKYGYYPINYSSTITNIGQAKVFDQVADPYITESDPATVAGYTGISIDHNTETMTISADHTVKEIYDYVQYDLTQNPRVQSWYSTTDGNSYTSSYSIVNNNALTGGGSINVGANTFTNNGTYDGVIITSSFNVVNISITGLVAGSRVQLYNVTDDTEVYNDIVSGTSLSLPFTWTADKSIRMRAISNSGTIAYQMFESTGTLLQTGLSFNAAQLVNGVYNTNGIDGSTVTECSISGTTVRIYVDDPDNATTWQRMYNWFQYYLSTQAGIRDQNTAYFYAIDSTTYKCSDTMRIVNSDTVNPLAITGGNCSPDTAAITNIIDTSNGASVVVLSDRVVDASGKLVNLDTPVSSVKKAIYPLY